MEESQGFDESGVAWDRGLAMLESVSETLFTCGEQVVVKVIRLIEQGTHVSFALCRIKGMNLLLLCLFLYR
jgi:hypothetical protein